MKRILSVALCFVMLMSLCLCVEAKNFSDLSSEHWAYDSIRTLVDEGTINGYEDGTFRPSNTVTRAEFAKMIGKWDRKHNGEYFDITSKHWAYEYIMWSGLESSGVMIYPDEPILRSDVINLIWKRNGSPKHSLAPSAISQQGTNSDATSWAYTIGLMKGDDGLNLRLDGSLTRAEAATLIVRSRKLASENAKNNFIDTVNDEVFEKAYEGLNLLDDRYDSERVLTYGELARMAIVFGSDDKNVQFVGNDCLNSKGEVVDLFEHKYSNELFVLSSNVWGDDYYKASVADKNATVQDAVSAIVYGFIRRGTVPMDYGDKDGYYSDCVDAKSTVMENMNLTYANKKGIKLYADEKLGSGETLTVKKFTALMLQFNEVAGLGLGYINGVKSNVKMNTNIYSTPANYKDFKLTISGVPVGLYGMKADGVDAKKSYFAISQCAFVYNAYIAEAVNAAKKSTGYAMDYTFYPSISYKQDGKVNFVAKFVLKNMIEGSSSVSVDELFKKVIKDPTGKKVEANHEFYVVFETYQPLMDIYLPLSGAYIKGVFVS